MDKLLLKSFSKINIGLKILNRRADGYHNIHTIFQEIDFHDTIILKKRNSGCDFISNVDWLSNDESNLCVKAWQCLVERFGIAGINIELQKQNVIPKMRSMRDDDGDLMSSGFSGCEDDVLFIHFTLTTNLNDLSFEMFSRARRRLLLLVDEDTLNFDYHFQKTLKELMKHEENCDNESCDKQGLSKEKMIEILDCPFLSNNESDSEGTDSDY